MPAPSTPTNFYVQQGNGKVLVSCDLTATATTYPVWRSTDGVTYSNVASPAVPSYLDTAVTVGTQYYYKIAASNGSGSSALTTAQTIVPTLSAGMTLGQIRLMAQQRADRVGSNFVTLPEWNTYINQSYFELYDLLITLFESYYVTTPYTFVTDGSSSQYTLPNGVLTDSTTGLVAAPFYKLVGVDLGLSTNSTAWVTIKKFDFVERNRFVYPQMTSTFLGVFNLQYRLVGNTLMFIPTPSGGQVVRVWYIPRIVQLLQDTDILDGISGWTEYVVVDAAIKALQKEESDTSLLVGQKMALKARIEESASNRDVGLPDTISDSRSRSETWGSDVGPWGGF